MTSVALKIALVVALGSQSAGAAAETAAPAVVRPVPIPTAYQLHWLEEVGPFLTDEEREAYLALDDSFLRTLFQRDFWRARDPTARSRLNEKKEQYLHHLVMVRANRLSLTDERARLRLLFGPPDSVHRHGQCDDPRVEPFVSGCLLAPTFEFDHYAATADRDAINVLLVATGGRCRLMPPHRALSVHLMSAGQCARSRERGLHAQISAAVRDRPTWPELAELGLRAPPLRSWVAGFADSAVASSRMTVDLRIVSIHPSASGRRQKDIGADVFELNAVLELPVRDDWWRHPMPWRNLYLRTDVLMNDRLVASFDAHRILHARPEESLLVPLQFEVATGRVQTVVVHVEDEAAELFETAAFEVELPVQRAGRESRPPPGVRHGDPGPVVTGPATQPIPNPGIELPRFEIAPLRGLRLGPTAVSVDSAGTSVVRVQYLLNGKPVASSSERPFQIEIDLGKVPRERTLEAVGFDSRGTAVARDRWTLNPGASRFRVRLADVSHLSPGTLHVRGRVDIPNGSRLDRVEVFEGDRLVTTRRASRFDYQRPETRQEAEGRAVVVSAVAHLADGRSSSDTRVVTRNPLEEVGVDLVEIFAAVRNRDGTPLVDLRADEVRVHEDGREQPLSHFERLENLPLNLLLLLDVSGTMKQEIELVRRAGTEFMERMIQQDDRAALVMFSGVAYVVAPFTNDLETLREGSRSITAWGGTAIWDSTVASVYYLLGRQGKSALVLLSDGFDRSSKIDFGATLEFAERSGIAVYAIGLGLRTTGTGGRAQASSRLRRLATRTGGRYFRVTGARELPEVYAQIEADLRSQYLIAYETSGGDESYRAIRVEVSRSGAQVEARPGYYP